MVSRPVVERIREAAAFLRQAAFVQKTRAPGTAAVLDECADEIERLRGLLQEKDNGYVRCLVCRAQWHLGDPPFHLDRCRL